MSWIFSRVAKLDRPITRRVQVERGIRIPMVDGTLSVANRYFPRNGEGLPVILIRTPYGLVTLEAVRRGVRSTRLPGRRAVLPGNVWV